MLTNITSIIFNISGIASQLSQNPYVNRAIIRNVHDFYGRKQEISRLYSRIVAEHPQSVAIIGKHRVGKSSLLLFLTNPENIAKLIHNPQRVLFVLLDFQKDRVIKVDDFCNMVMVQISKQINYINPICSSVTRRNESSNRDELLNAIQSLDAEGYKIILLIDDFDNIVQNSNFDNQFYSFLHSLANRYKVAYIITSLRPPQNLPYYNENPDLLFFNMFFNLYLGSFTEEEAQELIVVPSQSSEVSLEPYTDFLLDIGGRHPFFLQIACSELFEYLHAGNEFDYLGFEEVEASIMEESKTHFQYIWEQMDETERRIIKSIAEDKPIDLSDRSILRSLIQQGYVKENKEQKGNYREQKVELFSYLFVQFIFRIIADTRDQVISELEEKVRERTKELSEKNTELEKTLCQLQEAQSQLVIQEKMASLGNLVAGVAHEINNPLGVIHSAADVTYRGIQKVKNLLQDSIDAVRLEQNEKNLQQYLKLLEVNCEVITKASARIANIIQSLKTFARLDEALYQKVNIHENIDTTLTLIHHEMKDRITVIKDYGDIPPIQCYPSELNQMFMNLLKNAVQAIDNKGVITITTYSDGTYVYFKVSDTGKGIPPEVLSKVFDPGFTTQSGGIGIGLGLSIVYNIAQKHHGDIKVDTEFGKGTGFTIALPIEQH